MLVGCEEKTSNPVGEVQKVVILTHKAEIQEVPSSRDGITLEMEKVQYKPYDKEITLNVINESTKDLTEGNHFYLQKKENGIWFEIPYKKKMFTEEGLIIREKASMTLKVSELKYEFSPGEYRAVFNKLAAPFEVTLN